MPSPTVSIHIVAWNSVPHLADLLDSIFLQTYTDFSVLVIDNGSMDGVAEFLSRAYPRVRCLRNVRNLGFCGAHNQGIRYAIEHWDKDSLNNKFILIVNAEAMLTPTYLEELMKQVVDDRTGVFGGKMLRAYGDGISDEVFKSAIRSDRIDSTGLRLRKNLCCESRGAGELDKGQYDVSSDAFGISDSVALYRASALQAVRFREEFFDQDFFAGEEDVDLSWRLQAVGFGAHYEPRAVAYLHCGVYREQKRGGKVWRLEGVGGLAVSNHWLTLLKNIDAVSLFFSFPYVFASEMRRFVSVLFLERGGRMMIVRTLTLIPRMHKKRAHIHQSKRTTASMIRKQFAE